MPAQKSTAASLFTAIAGTLGFSALAGVLVTVMVAPAIAVTGITANNTVGIFNALPEYIELDPGSQQNTIVVRNPDVAADDVDNPAYYITVATIYKQNREEVELDEISDYLECAAIAGEDRRFYEHGGVDLPSLIRAAVGQVTGDDDSGGASTLTMQTVRNILQQQALNDDSLSEEEKKEKIQQALDPTLDRKIKEMKLAIGLERNYSKAEILQGYLNIAGFGGNTYGVQAAAEQYFGKDASELTIAEAASLIAIVQYPNLRDLQDPEHYPANEERRNVILRSMYAYGEHGDGGCITKDELDEALATPVDADFVHPKGATVGCRNAIVGYGFICDYVLHVVKELTALGGTAEERQTKWERGGYQVVLTIDPRVQSVAWDQVNHWAPADEARFQLGAATASVQVGTGNILAMAQNKNFDDALVPTNPLTSTAVNFASDVAHGGSQGFQPGSTYKPYVLLAFLAAGHGLGEAFNAGIREVNQADFADSCPPYYNAAGQLQGPPWGGKYTFKNDSNEQGSYTVQRGTAKSVNSVFIQMAKAVDQCDIRKIAESIGVHDASGHDLITRPSCSIGGCENNIAPITAAAAYAAIANHGVFCEPIMVAQLIVTETREPLAGQTPACGQSLVSPEVANTAAYAMAGVMNGGTGGASNPQDGTEYIGKTGTTDKSVHTWMVGSSTTVATAVWVGNIKGEQAMRNIRVQGQSGGVLRHRIFQPIAQAIDPLYPGGAFAAPDPALLVGSPVEVPNVVGMTPEAAKQAIEEVAELVYEDGGQVDSDLPVGQVAATDPGAGASVSKGTTVRVFTSNGLAEEVPDVVGLNRNIAEAQLQGDGFTVSQVCVDDGDLGIPPALPPVVDNVVSQDPPGHSFHNPATTTVTIRYYRPTCP
jgi:membrane peptidoglycan carboxypeptidase